jgi:hypothetical protein
MVYPLKLLVLMFLSDLSSGSPTFKYYEACNVIILSMMVSGQIKYKEDISSGLCSDAGNEMSSVEYENIQQTYYPTPEVSIQRTLITSAVF